MKWQEEKHQHWTCLGAKNARPGQQSICTALSFACMFQTTALPARARCTHPRRRLQALRLHAPRQPRPPLLLAQGQLPHLPPAQWLGPWLQQLRLVARHLQACPLFLQQPALAASLPLRWLPDQLPDQLPLVPPPRQRPQQHAAHLLRRAPRAQQLAASRPPLLRLLLPQGLRPLLLHAGRAGCAA